MGFKGHGKFDLILSKILPLTFGKRGQKDSFSLAFVEC